MLDGVVVERARSFSAAVCVAGASIFGPYHRQQGGPRADGTHRLCKGWGQSISPDYSLFAESLTIRFRGTAITGETPFAGQEPPRLATIPPGVEATRKAGAAPS